MTKGKNTTDGTTEVKKGVVTAEVATEPEVAETAEPTVTADEITVKLTALGLSSEAIEKLKSPEFGVQTVNDLSALEYEDFVAAGASRVAAKKLVADIKKEAAQAAKVATDDPEANYVGLQVVPEYSAISGVLRTNGVLNMTPIAVAFATVAAIAPNGIFDASSKLDRLIEANLRKQGKKAPTGYLKEARKRMTKTAYADILSVIEGPDAGYITNGRRDALITNVRNDLFPGFYKFYQQLLTWRKEYREDITDNLLLSAASGGNISDLVDEPSTRMLYASLEELVDIVNSVMAYDGEEVATAIGAEVVRVTELLRDESYWALAGVIDLDGLKARLDIKADSVSDMTEANLTRFAYNCMLINQDKNINKSIIKALIQCGNDIDWSAVGIIGIAGVPRVGGDRL